MLLLIVIKVQILGLVISWLCAGYEFLDGV